MPLPYGSYVVFGQFIEEGAAPQVHLLGGPALEYFQSQHVMTAKLLEYTFGIMRADSAIPAWSEAAMLLIAGQYSGQHETELRGLCAAIALGRPFGQDAKRKPDGSDTEGGIKVEAPKPPKTPKGGNKVSGFAALTTGVQS
jgi:hypothetical protein